MTFRHKKYFHAILLSLIFCLPVLSQPADSLSYSLATPYQTVYTHLFYLQPDTYHPEIAARTIRVDDPEKAEKLAIQLKQILDGKGLYVDLEAIPNQPDYRDSVSGKHRYVLFESLPQIYLEKYGDKWLYSKETVKHIPELHKKVYPFGSDWLISLLPAKSHKRVLGLYLWQYLGILILLVATAIVHQLLWLLIRIIIRQLSARVQFSGHHLEIITGISKPISLLLITMLLQLFVPMLQLPIMASKYVVMILNALTPFFAMVACYRGVDLLNDYLQTRAEKTESKLDDQLVPLVRKGLKVLVIIIGLLFILNNLNFNIAALLAGVSIGGLAVALAAQDTIKNLFGSLMIFVDRPFQIGDAIVAPDIEGTVETVGFRSTRIRTFENSVISVPNGKLADMTINNRGLRIYRRFRCLIAITYDTPPALIEKFVEGLRDIIAYHPYSRKDAYEVHLFEMGSTSLNILFNMFFYVPDWSTELKGRHEILLSIIKLAEKLGVRFAFPTQTIVVEEFPEKKSIVPPYETDIQVLDEKVKQFIEEYRSTYETGGKPGQPESD